MALWRAEALKRLPELRPKINSADSVMALWQEIWLAFSRAYEQLPRDESLIERVYLYADWCGRARRGPDAGRDPWTAVALCFHEHLPTFGPAREDMPRWISFDEVVFGKKMYSYLVGEEEYVKLVAHMAKNRGRYRMRTAG